MTATTIGPRSVHRRNRDQHATRPEHLVFKLTSVFRPTFVQDGFVETRFLLDVPARLIERAARRARQVATLQVFSDDQTLLLSYHTAFCLTVMRESKHGAILFILCYLPICLPPHIMLSEVPGLPDKQVPDQDLTHNFLIQLTLINFVPPHNTTRDEPFASVKKR